MPQKSYDNQFGTPVQIHATGPVAEGQLAQLLADDPEGVTIEVVVGGIGAGYLFHIEERSGSYVLKSYTSEPTAILVDVASLTRFVNHAAGLAFHEGSWRLSDEMNRRTEEQVDEESLDIEG